MDRQNVLLNSECTPGGINEDQSAGHIYLLHVHPLMIMRESLLGKLNECAIVCNFSTVSPLLFFNNNNNPEELGDW